MWDRHSRRQPTVPIAFVAGQLSAAAIASFHARSSHFEDGFACAGGSSSTRGGYAPP